MVDVKSYSLTEIAAINCLNYWLSLCSKVCFSLSGRTGRTWSWSTRNWCGL